MSLKQIYIFTSIFFFIFLLGEILVPVADKGALLLFPSKTVAATSGPRNCGTSVNDSSVGSVAWTNPSNVCSGGTSTATSISDTSTSQYLKATNFGFSLPSNAVVLGIQVNVSRDGTLNKGKRATDSAVRIVKGGTIGSVNKADSSNWDQSTSITYGSTTDLWGLTWTGSDINASNFGVVISAKSNGNQNVNATFTSYITITVTYNSPPGATTMNSPSNGATGVSTTPTYLMSASDSDGNNISYQVVVYSNSGCSTVVQTNSQSASSTGWAFTDATCTNSPTSCYSSGTGGVYTGQTALSADTQYWWAATAKDPDGSNTYGTAGGCYSFTTASAAVVSVSVTSDGSISYGTLAASASANTTASGLNDTQTVENDGDVTETFNIKTSTATGGTAWSLGSSAGADTFVHEFSTNSGGAWTKFTTADSYQTLATGIASSGTQNFDLRLTAPSSTTDYQEKTITITIQAVEE